MNVGEPIERWFEPKVESIAQARRFAAGSVPPDVPVGDDVALLVTELAANAVLHAGTPYRVSVTMRSGTISVAVTDQSDTVPLLVRAEPLASAGGRGLAIVDAVAQRWGVDLITGSGKTTWFELDHDVGP